MELDTRELFRCLARDCNYRDENYAMFQKRIALHETIYCSQSSEALGGFWSFLKLYMYIQIETSHKKRRAKNQTEILSRIAKQQFRYKQCFQRNNTLTADTDDQKFNCGNADGHSQTGNRKKINVGKLNSKDKPWEQRLREAPWDFVYTLSIEH